MLTVFESISDGFYTAFFKPDPEERKEAIDAWVRESTPIIQSAVENDLITFVDKLLEGTWEEKGWGTRAKKFYESLFGWKFKSVPGMDYHFIETSFPDGKPGIAGGMGKRTAPDERITNFIGVDSVDEYLKKVGELGGKVMRPKIPVPGWGYLAVCMDTEGNTFGLWQEDKEAKKE